MLLKILKELARYIPWVIVGFILPEFDITVRTWQFYVLIICMCWIYISGIRYGKK